MILVNVGSNIFSSVFKFRQSRVNSMVQFTIAIYSWYWLLFPCTWYFSIYYSSFAARVRGRGCQAFSIRYSYTK